MDPDKLPWRTGEPTPEPTSDPEIAQARLHEYGYCILENALSPDVLAEARDRLVEQADAEREAGIAFEDQGPDQGRYKDFGVLREQAFTAAAGGVNQRVWMLVNKGKVFCDAVTHPTISPIVASLLGPDFLLSTLSANIAKPGGLEMGLHTDQWWMPRPLPRREAPVVAGDIERGEFYGAPEDGPETVINPPVVCNVIYFLSDFTDQNGGTRLVPKSHLSGQQPPPDVPHTVPSVAAAGPAGAAAIVDGRTWHGTGANRANGPRLGFLATYCAPQFRTQENLTYGTDPAVLEGASDELLTRLGFKIWNAYGRTGDPHAGYVYPPRPPVGEMRKES